MCAVDEDMEDAIVEEIPVLLSQNLQDNLFLFQYPTKTSIDNQKVTSCLVKPISQEVKVEFEHNLQSRFYDPVKGEQLAIAADGKTQAKGDKPMYKRGIIDKYVFKSSRALENVDNYIVGIFADKELHITPLTGILQMRPSFCHIEKEDVRIKAEQKESIEHDDEDDVQQVTVKFARTGVGAKDIKAKQSYEDFLKRSADEPWCDSYWHTCTSPISELERQKLYSTNHQINHTMMLETEKYVEKLLPCEGQSSGIDAVLPPIVISKARLRSMTLIEQLKTILVDGKMLSFENIMSILQNNIDRKITNEKVLRTLPQVGVLIHGNWVPQSEMLYPSNTLSHANGVISNLMLRARDYVLFRFSRITFLYRRQVISATQLPAEEASEVLQSVARLNQEKKWELLLPPDKDFEQRHPDLVQRQEIVWRATEQTYYDMDSEKSPKRTRKRSIRDSKASLTLPPPSMQTEVAANLT